MSTPDAARPIAAELEAYFVECFGPAYRQTLSALQRQETARAFYAGVRCFEKLKEAGWTDATISDELRHFLDDVKRGRA